MKTIDNRKKVERINKLFDNDFDAVASKIRIGKLIGIFEYAKKNIDTLDLNNKIEKHIGDEYLKHLLNKESLSFAEKKWLVSYLSLSLSLESGIDFKVDNVISFDIIKNKTLIINKLKIVNRFIGNALAYKEEKINKKTYTSDYSININHKNLTNHEKENKELLSTINLIVTLFHEFIHILQSDDKYFDIMDSNNMITTKEEILLREGFYLENYDDLIIEVEADLASFIKTLDLYKEYSPERYEENKEIITEYINFYQKKRDLYILKDSEEYDLGELIIAKHSDQRIKENPKIINSFLGLRYEYERDGTPKSVAKLILEENKCKDIYKDKYKNNKDLKDNLNDFYSNIIWTRLIREEIDYENLYSIIDDKGFTRIINILNWKMKQLNYRDQINKDMARESEETNYEFLKNGMVIDKNKAKNYNLSEEFKNFLQNKRIEQQEFKKEKIINSLHK